MSASPRFLHLHLHAPAPQVLKQVQARHPDITIAGSRAIVPLARYRAEEVMAECRRLGLSITASEVKRSADAG